MVGKINRQVKSGKPVLVNGKWAHQHLDRMPPTPAQMKRMIETAERLGLKSK